MQPLAASGSASPQAVWKISLVRHGVVSHRDSLRVIQPARDVLGWKLSKQLGFASRPHVVPDPWPSLMTCSLDDPAKLGAEVAVVGPAVAFNDVNVVTSGRLVIRP